MKLSLLAKSCLCPGLVVLITNLIKSSKNPPKEFLEQKQNENFRWLNDYWQGKKYEIYRIEIPSVYAGRSFSDIAHEVYKDQGFVLFALEIVIKDRPNGEILLNPGSTKLPVPYSSNVAYTYFGYIIAPDKELAEMIFMKNVVAKSNNDLLTKPAETDYVKISMDLKVL